MGHQVLHTNIPVLQQLEEKFGKEIFFGSSPTDDELSKENFKAGKRIINRRALGKIVFADRTLIDTLNHIMWPTIAEYQNMGNYLLGD